MLDQDSLTQRQYDAFFSFGYQNGFNRLKAYETGGYSIGRWLAFGDLTNQDQAKQAFGDWIIGTAGGKKVRLKGSQRRRLDELDILFKNDYTRDDDIDRYGDIWQKNFTWYPK